MWVMTTGGYVSAVRHRDNPELLMVRGRDKRSLKLMLDSIRDGLKAAGEPEVQLPDIISEPKDATWDYPHRVTLHKSLFQWFLMYEVDHYLDYGNFKSAATKASGEKYHQFLMSVWSRSHDLTEPAFRWVSKFTGGTTTSTTGKYGTTYHGASAFAGGGVTSTGTGLAGAGAAAPPATTAATGSEDAAPRTGTTVGAYSGTLYSWDDQGKIAGQTPIRRKTSIHDLPDGVDPDDIIDVDEEGAPVMGRTSSFGYELPEIDAIAAELDAMAEDDSIYKVNLDTGAYREPEDEDVDLTDDKLFSAWLAMQQLDGVPPNQLDVDTIERRREEFNEQRAAEQRIDDEADARFKAWIEERKNAGAGLPEVEAVATVETPDELEEPDRELVEASPNPDVAATPE